MHLGTLGVMRDDGVRLRKKNKNKQTSLKGGALQTTDTSDKSRADALARYFPLCDLRTSEPFQARVTVLSLTATG